MMIMMMTMIVEQTFVRHLLPPFSAAAAAVFLVGLD